MARPKKNLNKQHVVLENRLIAAAPKTSSTGRQYAIQQPPYCKRPSEASVLSCKSSDCREQKAFPLAQTPGSYLLSYLESSPPSWEAAIGVTTELPPTPRSFSGNKRFAEVLDEVLGQHAIKDDDLKAQAKALASPGGSTLGARTGGAGGASYVHTSPRSSPKRLGDVTLCSYNNSTCSSQDRATASSPSCC